MRIPLPIALISSLQHRQLTRCFMTVMICMVLVFQETPSTFPAELPGENLSSPMTAADLKQKIAKLKQDLEFEKKLEAHLFKAKSLTEKLKSANSTIGKGLRFIGKMVSKGESEKAILKEVNKVNTLIAPHFKVDTDGNLIWGDALRTLMMLGGVQAQFVPPAFTALTPETADQIIQEWRKTNQEQQTKNEELLHQLTRTGITLELSASSLNVNRGDLLTYTYVVTNIGGTAVRNLAITDFNCRAVRLSHKGDGDDLLAPKERWTYECSTQLDKDTTSIVTAKRS